MKKITILGSTGSIGTQSLDVIGENPDKFKIEALTCGSNIDLLEKQIERFKPEVVVVAEERDALSLKNKYKGTEFFWGERGLILAATTDSDVVLNALMGIRGLAPTYAAILAGHDIALANKETLVAGGEIIMDSAAKAEVRLLPVDSEHSAVFQCLEGNQNRPVKRILLTASGGPFRGYTTEQLEKVTLEQALNHPKWNMGKKITIDSATMMNKGLEVIEAKWLFGVGVDDIQILVHPQSIVHSMVEFADTSVIAQMGLPDMRIPISLALGYPGRLESSGESLDFFTTGAELTFEKPDPEVFRCIKLAYEASKAGGSYPAAMNGANEVLVDLFLKGKIGFMDIQNNLERILDSHKAAYNLDLEGILEIDREIREYTYSVALGESR